MEKRRTYTKQHWRLVGPKYPPLDHQVHCLNSKSEISPHTHTDYTTAYYGM